MARCILIVMMLAAVASADVPKDHLAAVSYLLAQHGAQETDEAVRRMTALLDAQPGAATAQMWQQWLTDLSAQGRYADTAALTRRAIMVCHTNTGAIEGLLRLRVRALLREGETQEALADAKRLFDVARMDQTAGAILLFAECLDATHPGDVEIGEQFRQEQTAGAARTTGAAPAPTILESVRVDPTAYDQRRSQLYGANYLIRSGAFTALMGQGNLLLLADRGTEAEVIFRKALESADVDQLLAAREGVARAIKAEDGAIGRANAWIKSQ